MVFLLHSYDQKVHHKPPSEIPEGGPRWWRQQPVGHWSHRPAAPAKIPVLKYPDLVVASGSPSQNILDRNDSDHHPQIRRWCSEAFVKPMWKASCKHAKVTVAPSHKRTPASWENLGPV